MKKPCNAKKQKVFDDPLVDIRRGTHVTNVGIEKILQYVKDHGLPDRFSDSSQTRAVAKCMAELTTPYGPVLQDMAVHLEDGRDDIVYVANPWAMLHITVERCDAFKRFLRECLVKTPCTIANPWGLILYFDEVTPTDALSTKLDQRQVQAVYWTLDAFRDYLFCEEIWFAIACTRSTIVNGIEIAMCAFVKDLLREHFFNEHTFDFRRHGITLDVGEPGRGTQLVRLFIGHRVTVADFKALKEVLYSMGHNGIQPCPKCKNVVIPSLANGADLFSFKDLDVTRWSFHTDESVRGMLEYMRGEKARIANSAFGPLQSRMGYHFNENHIALDPHLRYKSISTLMFDWPHVFCVKGVINIEINAFIDKVREITPDGMKGVIVLEDLHAHVHTFEWPSRQKACRNLFETGKLSAAGSDLLRAAPAIRHFCQTVVMTTPALEAFHPIALSLSLGCDALEYLQCASRKQVTPQQLQNAVMQYLRAHTAAYGDSVWVFKHHMAAHIAEMYASFGYLADSFVTERKHRNPKRYAMARKSRVSYEKGMMSDMILQHIEDWSAWCIDRITTPTAVPKKLHAYVSDVFPGVDINAVQIGGEYHHASGAKFCKSDIVLLSSSIGMHVLGEVWYHFQIGADNWTCVSLWELKSVTPCGVYAMYRYTERPKLYKSSALRCTCITRNLGDERFAIIPLSYRMNPLHA